MIMYHIKRRKLRELMFQMIMKIWSTKLSNQLIGLKLMLSILMCKFRGHVIYPPLILSWESGQRDYLCRRCFLHLGETYA